MFIDKIDITNFRVYKGSNSLTFSSDTEQNITLVAGNNGFGKTSFLTSLVWVLYGKLMVDVDERYRQEIIESGGYSRYCQKLMNRSAFEDAKDVITEFEKKLTNTSTPQSIKLKSDIDAHLSFSVKLTLSNILIPSVPCKKLEVERIYNTSNNKEKLVILIDGRENELTKTVGPEIFINDFILPKEIAKFFFFDAEKIVFLADISTAEEKKYLSRAYAEVLGIKRYTDLKDSLEQMRLRIRTKSANKSDRTALDKLQKALEQTEKLETLKRDEFAQIETELDLKNITSDKYQEQLIREGSSISLEELKRLRERKQEIAEDLAKLRLRFTDMLELAPLAMLGRKMEAIKTQLELESSNSPAAIALLRTKLDAISELLNAQLTELSEEKKAKLLQSVKAEMLPENTSDNVKMLFGFTQEQQEKFYRVYEIINQSFGKNFKALLSDQKRLNTIHAEISRKLSDGEAKGKDPIIAEIRASKEKTDQKIKELIHTKEKLENELRQLNNERNSLLRQTSELSKKVNLADVDEEKDHIAQRLIDKLDLFIKKLKTKKKASLEKNIKFELNRLMHKADFVNRVEVIIDGELIDIELFDDAGKFIHKELLSKGEQQLYATALLKALVDESNVRFPVFIDSPLQKFDRQHSQNIIKEFYPNLSAQVVLLPLLEKELNVSEYNLMEEKVGKCYLIKQNRQFQSQFEEVAPPTLFSQYQQMQNSHV